MRLARTLIATVLIAACAATVHAEDEVLLPPGNGTQLAKGVSVRTEISPRGDTDSFAFAGVAGQRVTLTAKRAKGSPVDPELTIFRPDGSIADSGFGKRVRLTVDIDETGVWTADLTSTRHEDVGAVQLGFKERKIPRAADSVDDLGSTDQFVFRFDTIPGATVKLGVRYAGSPPEFIALRGPSGETIDVAEPVAKRGRLRFAPFQVPLRIDPGECELELIGARDDSTRAVRASAVVKAMRVPKKARRRLLSGDEPIVSGVPFSVGRGAEMTIRIQGADTQSAETPSVFLGPHKLEWKGNLLALTGATFLNSHEFVVLGLPNSMPVGSYPLHVRSQDGQWVTSQDPVIVAQAPIITSIAPAFGPTKGGFPIELEGVHLPGANDVEVLFDGIVAGPVPILAATPTSLRFLAPPHAAGDHQVSIRSKLELVESVDDIVLQYRTNPVITRVSPSLVSALGGATIEIHGGNFESTDQVLIETDVATVVDVTASTTTFVSTGLHRFTAPVLPAGRYRVVIVDNDGVTNDGGGALVVFELADVTSDLGLSTLIQNDVLDGVATAFADFDDDGNDDLFISRSSFGPLSVDKQTRVLRSDGNGGFEDVTSVVIPNLPPGDDYRAEKVIVQDFTGDGYPDLFLGSADPAVPASGSSVRLLENVAIAGAPFRAFDDVTIDIMPPPRERELFRMVDGVRPKEIADKWTTRDAWIGDLDGDGGLPNLVIVDEFTREDVEVMCGNYCPPFGSYLLISAYWGGTRVFQWDAAKRGGLGAFVFDADRMPRVSRPVVQLSYFGLTGCNSGTPCRDTFTPFTGFSLAVTDLNNDGRNDIAVANPSEVKVRGEAISSLQVALNGFSSVPLNAFGMTDVTDLLDPLGGDFRSDVVVALEPREGETPVLISTSASAPSGASQMRVIRAVVSDDNVSFEELTNAVVPLGGTGEEWQAINIVVFDIDGDGRDDVALQADGSPSGADAALRLLRNVPTLDGDFELVAMWRDLIDDLVAGGEFYDGRSVTIGDPDGDGLRSIAITRGSDTGAGVETRVLKTKID